MARKDTPTYETEKEIFPTHLRELMQATGITQSKLAEVTGVTRQAISLYATGQSTPDIKILYEISKHFNVSCDYLLGLSGYSNRYCETDEVSENIIENVRPLALGIFRNLNECMNNTIDRIPFQRSKREYSEISQQINDILFSYLNKIISIYSDITNMISDGTDDRANYRNNFEDTMNLYLKSKSELSEFDNKTISLIIQSLKNQSLSI